MNIFAVDKIALLSISTHASMLASSLDDAGFETVAKEFKFIGEGR